MARSATSGRSIPGNLRQGSGIYPIIPYRVRLQRVDDTNLSTLNTAVLDFDLQFEDNEVMDIIAIESEVNVTDLAIGEQDAQIVDEAIAVWLMENPELTAVNVLEDPYVGDGNLNTSQFSTNSALIWYHEEDYYFDMPAAAVGSLTSYVHGSLSRYRCFTLPQPYTVARNVLVGAKHLADGETGDIDGYRINFTIWGRRRKAAVSEFQNIVYRQRF